YSDNPTQHKVKRYINQGEQVLNNYKKNMLKAFTKIKKHLDISIKEVDLNPCEKCGYPTTSNICKYCRIKSILIGDK
ncbi:hypothetical protein J7K74_01760, partial [Candidatus Woesearchaeota archaeon]|nr:hypothetical protein [Candidatus Woesearchaeota archaeon]